MFDEMTLKEKLEPYFLPFDLDDEAVNNLIEAVEEEVIDALHEECAVCGHCGKKTCVGKKEHSTLPYMLNSSNVLEAIKKVFDKRIVQKGENSGR